VASSVSRGFNRSGKGGALMASKLFVYLILAGLVCGYAAMIYGLIYQLLLIQVLYLQHMAM
jgi:hypothetical protein